MNLPRTSLPKRSRVKARKTKLKRVPTKYEVRCGVKHYPDGREVCLPTAEGRAEYQRRLDLMASRQMNRCAICHTLLGDDRTFEHEAGRGHGGSHQDDRIWHDDGRPRNAALHGRCNTAKGSRRYHWQEGVFFPAVFATVADWMRSK